MKHEWQSGLSLSELLIVIAVSGLLVAGVSLFFTRGIGVNREQYEQVLITEEARIQLERVSDTLRNARVLSGANWLIAAGDYAITLTTNLDADADSEEVRYFLEDTVLKRGVTEPGGTEVVIEVAQSMRNSELGRPLFAYYDDSNQSIAAADATADNVWQIEIALLVDVNPNQIPAAVDVVTRVFPRRNGSVALAGAQELWPARIHFPSTVGSGSPPTIASGEVVMENQDTGVPVTEIVTVSEINRRLTIFDKGYDANINYQFYQVGSDPIGWY
ncbi:MAG: PilW family protein, partial [Acidobacteriota bacterium]